MIRKTMNTLLVALVTVALSARWPKRSCKSGRHRVKSTRVSSATTEDVSKAASKTTAKPHAAPGHKPVTTKPR
jgi:hypothetical protein